MLCGTKLFVLLVVVVGVCSAEEKFRNLQIPQDLGTPAVSLWFLCSWTWVWQEGFLKFQCLFGGGSPCTSEDYKKGSEYREKYIKDRVNGYVDEDVAPPSCLKTKDCAKDVSEAYEKKREEKYQEIYEQLKKANHLN